MNEMNQSRSKALLEKVYDYLDSIDVTKLSMRDLQDFLEVVQKGQFLESFGKVPQYALGGFGFPGSSSVGQSSNGVRAGDGETTAEK